MRMIRNTYIRHFLRLRYAKLSTETNVARTKEGEFEWHTDHINHREPARLSILQALAAPDAGAIRCSPVCSVLTTRSVGSHVSLGLEGQSKPEGEHFIRQLTRHATAPAFRYRHQWSVGVVVLWDNRRVLNAGTYYDVRSSRRLMHRTTVREDQSIR